MHEKGKHPVAVLWVLSVLVIACSVPVRASDEAASVKREVSSGGPALQTSHFKLDTSEQSPQRVTPNRTSQKLDLAPALLVENQGQWADPAIRYVHDGTAVDVALKDDGIVFRAGTRVEFSASFVGARPVRPAGLQRSDTAFNYCVGDHASWRTGVASYQKVVYPGLYEGIDLHVQGLRSRLKYEFHVAPGADYRRIAVRYEGIEGLSVRDDGSLAVDVGGRQDVIRDDAPYVYQEIDGRRIELAGRFVVRDERTYAFEVTGDIHPGQPLVIDPNVAWSTYLGGTQNDYATDVAADASGNVYVVGWTDSPDWASGGYDTTYEGNFGDAFVAKLDSAGEHVWTTYVGGTVAESGRAIALDAQSNVYIVGYTNSPNWPSGGYDTQSEGNDVQEGDGFIVKLTSAGAHVWSSYVGGNSHDIAEGVAVDPNGYVYVAGTTDSLDWITGGFDPNFNGGSSDVFLVKLTPAGGYVWGTYLGGAMADYDAYVAAGDVNSVYVLGMTESPGWAVQGYDTTLGGDTDAFLVKLTGDGRHLWSTYLGGEGQETGAGLAVDRSGAVYAGGSTNSPDWVSGGFDTTLGDAYSDAYVVKLAGDGQHLWSTYLGGANAELADDICVDEAGNVYAVGDVYVAEGSEVSPWVSGGFDTTFNGGYYDGFLVKLTGDGAHAWSSFIGGAGDEGNSGVAVNPAGEIFVVGGTASVGWISGGYDTTLDGEEDAFVLKITDVPATPAVAKTPVYRFWSPIYTRHVYTISESEKQNLIDNFSDAWTYEGIAYYVPADGNEPGALPVYRFWSESAGADFYTISEDEKDVLIRDFSYVWAFEGTAFYAFPEGSQPAGAAPVYRFWSATIGEHFYTISEEEKDVLIRSFSHIWTFEGIAWYAYPP
jgi:hypothetical protein